MLLKNKVIFLTGGTQGIGFECAKVYHKAGAMLCIISDSEKSIQQAAAVLPGDDIMFIRADVSNAKDIKNAIADALKRFGKIDVIHNNAGISNPSKTADDTTDEEWNRLFEVNVKGVYNTTKFGVAELKKTKGNILNTGSLVGDIGQENHAAYSATKGAINALTKSMALDYAQFGVRVNAVAPAAGHGRRNVGRFPHVIRTVSRCIDLWLAGHRIFHCCMPRCQQRFREPQHSDRLPVRLVPLRRQNGSPTVLSTASDRPSIFRRGLSFVDAGARHPR